MSETPFQLRAAARFTPVIDAFKKNFEDAPDRATDHGASFCVYQDGEKLIDLKGGWADRAKTQPIDNHHLFSVYSSGKAVAALIIAHLADLDRVGYNQLVKSIWPEFSAHGKENLTVAQLMSHQSGLSGISRADWSPEDWYDWDKTIAALESQDPLFEPGSASGYSPVTFGFLVGEIASRVDGGLSLGQILRQDFCDSHNIDVWLGLPASEHHRCVDMQKPRRLANFGDINSVTKAAFMESWSSPGRKGVEEWREAQLAGSNCQATAEGLARLMQMYNDGTVGGEKFLSEDILEQLREPRISGPDLVLPFDVTFAAGVMLNTPNYFYGPNPDTVGHSGWGGSCVFADQDAGISAAYVMTRQDNSLMGDPRAVALIDALYDCL